MQIEQALYGEARGGHSLLEASRNDAVSREIVQRLDLPDTAPPGVEWSPFLRGFPYRDRYLLSRTFLDTRASRGGMVFSHALIAPLDEIVRTSDLRPLLALLTSDARSRPPAISINLVDITTHPPEADDLLDMAEALASMIELPIVRAGQAGFDELVVGLWARLLAGMRRHFAFRLSFGPNDLVEDLTPALVCTPHSMVGRWTKYRVIKPSKVHQPTSLASAVLSGQGDSSTLVGFMGEIGVEPSTFTDLRLFDKACRLSCEESPPENCIGAVRLVGKLSPSPDVGCVRKEFLVLRLLEAMSKASAEHILLMRNLQLSAFPSPFRVWQTLKTWVVENIYPQAQDRDMLSALQDANSGCAVPEWQAAFLDGLAAAARACKSYFRNAFWRWIQTCPDVVDSALYKVLAESSVERCLAEAAPCKIGKDIAETILALARSRRWLRIHGVVLSAFCNPLDSVRQQITVDTDLSFIEGVRLSLRNSRPDEVVNCALEIGDRRTILLASELVAKRPDLLTQVNVREMNAQAVWREALVINYDSWQGPVNPEEAFHTLLNSFLDGGETDLSLIDQLSATPVGDLVSYPRRDEVWLQMEGATLKKLLSATATGWLKHASDGHVPFRPETKLQSALLAKDELEQTLNELVPGSVGRAISIISVLDGYTENRFKCLIPKIISSSDWLSVPEVEEVGRLIMDREWKTTAECLVEQYRSGQHALRPSLSMFYKLLDFWTRYSLGLKRQSKSEKWNAFEDLATQLYPGGPSDEGVWERAGGSNGDLSFRETGRNQWREALRKVRSGKGVHLIAILEVMKEDFPNNRYVFRISEDPAFIEKR